MRIASRSTLSGVLRPEARAGGDGLMLWPCGRENRLMPGYDLPRRVAAEALGTALLVATVVGSGIMAESLTKDLALALLGNTIATGAMLVVLITTLGPVSGAHFNPAVSLIFALRRELPTYEAGLYSAAQLAGGVAGTVAAHLMFALPLVQTSLHVRTGGAQWFSEGVASFGLVLTILAGIRFDQRAVPWLVGLYITAAYWFTASTSFANPAVAVARALTNTFSGIRPADLPGFIAAQFAGGAVRDGADGLDVAGAGRRGQHDQGDREDAQFGDAAPMAGGVAPGSASLADAIHVEREPPARPVGNHCGAILQLEGLVVEGCEPGHVFQPGRVLQSG